MGQFGAILWAKTRMARHLIASVRTESKLKIIVVGTSGCLLWILMLAAFLSAFHWLQEFQPATGTETLSLGDVLMARLLSVFTLALFFMLIFSNVLISFSTMYKAREVAYLLNAPISVRAFFVSRLTECISFSSWASAFLGSPLLLAYGYTTDAHWGYYAAALLFYPPFVTIPAALGAFLTLWLVRIFPRLPRVALLALACIALVAMFLFLRKTMSAERLSDDAVVNLVLQTTGQTQSPYLPSFWVAQGLLAAAANRYRESFFLLGLLVSNALFVVWLATETANRIFLAGFSAIMGSDNNRPRPLGRGVLGRLDSLLGFIHAPFKPLIIKDIKLFWRDPTQWTQFVIFFGIMAVYIANLGNSSMGYKNEAYRNFVVILNNGACLLILASLTSRFVYPLISLEGFRFWILGLAPLTIRQLMWQKFWLSVAMTLPFMLTLTTLTCLFLDVGAVRFLVAVYSVLLANVALSGLAVGLGSIYPNFQEDNPARIVSGMGGTLNFLLSIGYITFVVGTQGVILQWNVLGRYARPETFWYVLAIVLIANTLLSALALFAPMRLGHRNLLRTEF
ncbi:MAG: hypothetical protein AAB353_04855 [Candidatus Hydrogenedentota bacterium]